MNAGFPGSRASFPSSSQASLRWMVAFRILVASLVIWSVSPLHRLTSDMIGYPGHGVSGALAGLISEFMILSVVVFYGVALITIAVLLLKNQGFFASILLDTTGLMATILAHRITPTLSGGMETKYTFALTGFSLFFAIQAIWSLTCFYGWRRTRWAIAGFAFSYVVLGLVIPLNACRQVNRQGMEHVQPMVAYLRANLVMVPADVYVFPSEPISDYHIDRIRFRVGDVNWEVRGAHRELSISVANCGQVDGIFK